MIEGVQVLHQEQVVQTEDLEDQVVVIKEIELDPAVAVVDTRVDRVLGVEIQVDTDLQDLVEVRDQARVDQANLLIYLKSLSQVLLERDLFSRIKVKVKR